jgi:hypothetical protein
VPGASDARLRVTIAEFEPLLTWVVMLLVVGSVSWLLLFPLLWFGWWIWDVPRTLSYLANHKAVASMRYLPWKNLVGLVLPFWAKAKDKRQPSEHMKK